jgi:hypothetical protein
VREIACRDWFVCLILGSTLSHIFEYYRHCFKKLFLRNPPSPKKNYFSLNRNVSWVIKTINQGLFSPIPSHWSSLSFALEHFKLCYRKRNCMYFRPHYVRRERVCEHILMRLLYVRVLRVEKREMEKIPWNSILLQSTSR